MKKYVIGLAILGLITVGLAVYVISLGTASKQDKETYAKAQSAATTLNNYVSSKQKIPASLQEAGVNDAPGTVRYSKLSDDRYEFCVTYKTDRGFSGGTDITSALYAGSLTNMANSSSGRYDTEINSTEASYLYLNYSYKKGETCQKIAPRLYGSSRSSTNQGTGDSLDDYYQQAYDTYCRGSSATDYASYCSQLQKYLTD